MQAGKRFADREAFSFPLGYYFEICVRGRLSMTLKSVSLSSAMFLLCFSSMAAAQDASSTTQAAQPAPQSSPTVQPQAQAAEPPRN